MLALWFDKEAEIWEEALPLGNGRIGAMVWSGVKTERLSLNEDSLWSGRPTKHNKEGADEHFRAARELVMRGEYKQAQEIIETHILGEDSQRYLPMGELILEFEEPHSEVKNYRRELDLETALSTLIYEKNGAKYERETFVSAPDNALVMRLRSGEEGFLNFKPSLTCQLEHKIYAEGDSLILEGVCDKNGISFIAIANIETISESEVIIRLVCRSDFAGAFMPPALGNIKYRENAEKDMKNALSLSYGELKRRHTADYQKLFERVEIDFGKSKDKYYLPLPQRLSDWENSESDPALFALLFQYGRYLLIAGSRPGTRPLNLQGIWNRHLTPPWGSNYTLNINAEMNYWAAESTNLSECHLPLFDFINDLRVSGAKTARTLYGASGFTAHHNSDIWAMSTPVRSWDGFGTARWGFWGMGAGWLSAHVFAHYEYNQVRSFLRDAVFPVIKSAAEFYLDVLTEDSDGTLIFAPSTSPENDFVLNGGVLAVSKTTAMTTAIIRETLRNAAACCEILKTDDDFKNRVKSALGRLPPYKIGSRGELLEWSEELAEHEPNHRHVSHLYPLYPGNEILPNTPLAEACAKTLELRGAEGTGWALAWRICLWARLLNGEKAFEFLKKQLRPCEDKQGGCYPNLFGSHPPFQIDSNFGACAGIAEMLLQSRKAGEIALLPALPKALNTGYVKGLRAKGGVTVNIYFERGIVKKAELTLDKNVPAAEFIVSYNDRHKTLRLEPGEITVLK